MKCFYLALGLLMSLCAANGVAQSTFFDQDFTGGGPYESAAPGTALFDKIVSTHAQSFAEEGSGYLDLVRQAPGGLVRAIRSTPFAPTPTSLYAQWTMSVEEIIAPDNNAVYFYIGRDFRTDNSSIVPNDNLFARFSLNFQSDNTYVIRDLQTNTNSLSIGLKTPVTITWVMNNSNEGHVYKMPDSVATPDHKVMPGKYDLWINGTPLVSGISAYPGSGVKYDANQLTNFEVKFWTGLGRVRFHNFKIRDIAGILPIENIVVEEDNLFQQTRVHLLTNPTTSSSITIKHENVLLREATLYSVVGEVISSKLIYLDDHLTQLYPAYPLVSGVYIVCYSYGEEQRCEKVIVY